MKLKRQLHGSETGADVRVVQRALNKASREATPSRPTIIAVTGTYDATTQRRVRSFRMARSLNANKIFDQEVLDELWPYFDLYGKWTYKRFSPPPIKTKADITFEKLLTAMQEMTERTPGYLLGGGHGIPLYDVSPGQKLDCSSSCSKALYEAGIFPDSVAWVSGKIATSYGKPGTGNYFTVYANSEHVFIRLHKSKWWRFDTSPHGDGGRGPRLRYLPRFTSGFVARHYDGL